MLAKIALCGLERYPDIWSKFSASLSTINLGIGGDKVENILWRMEDMLLPPTVDFLFLHCGSNNLHPSSPIDIADGILAIGIMAKRKRAYLKVIVGDFLHCDQEAISSSVAEIKGFEAENP